MTIKAVIFDFDGTIIDTETIWFHAYKEVLLEKFGMELPLEEFAKIVGTTNELLFRYIETTVGIKVDPNVIDELADRRFLDNKGVLNVREGVREKLDEAKRLGLKIGLASSSSRKWVENFLRQYDLWDYFSVVKTREDVKKVKPDPALYLMALEDLEVEPHEALAIEDSVNGAMAAVASGIKCVVIPNQVTAYSNFHESITRLESFNEIIFN